MRTNGVSAFPDPDSSGQLTIDGVADGTRMNPSTPAFQRALTACKSLEPAGFMGSQRTPAQQAAALKFAQCMRDQRRRGLPATPPQPGRSSREWCSQRSGVRGCDAEVRRNLLEPDGAGGPVMRKTWVLAGGGVLAAVARTVAGVIATSSAKQRAPAAQGTAGEHGEGAEGKALGHGLPEWDPDLSGAIGRFAVRGGSTRPGGPTPRCPPLGQVIIQGHGALGEPAAAIGEAIDRPAEAANGGKGDEGVSNASCDQGAASQNSRCGNPVIGGGGGMGILSYAKRARQAPCPGETPADDRTGRMM